MKIDQHRCKQITSRSRLFFPINTAFFLLQAASCQPGKRLFTVVFYNVENLYDVYDDPKVNDNEFLPITMGEGRIITGGNRDMPDHIIVSSAFLNNRGLPAENKRGYVFQRPRMTYINPQDQQVPNRICAGKRYTGGISDHLPVFMRLIK